MKTRILTVGDRIKVNRSLYTHHGIYTGNGFVIHYGGLKGSTHKKECIIETHLDEFSDGEEVIPLERSINAFDRTKVVKRARSRLGEDSYNLIRNNCEHFTTWCESGKASSKQVQKAAINTVLTSASLLQSSLNALATTGGQRLLVQAASTNPVALGLCVAGLLVLKARK